MRLLQTTARVCPAHAFFTLLPRPLHQNAVSPPATLRLWHPCATPGGCVPLGGGARGADTGKKRPERQI